MIKILGVIFHNIRLHKNREINFDGKSVALIGDKGVGKSTVIEIIESHLGIIDYPKDALTTGATDGRSEMMYIDTVTGKKYNTIRRFTKGKLQRFDMRSVEDNGKLIWQDEIKKIFNGVDPKISYFDYATYFFEQKSADSRFEYAMKCALGETYLINVASMEKLEKERWALGSKSKVLEVRLQDSEITPENYDELAEQYQEPKTLEKAQIERDTILDKRPNVKELIEELQELKEKNAWYIQTQTTLKYLKDERAPQLVVQLNEATELRELAAAFLPAVSLHVIDVNISDVGYNIENTSPYGVSVLNKMIQRYSELRSDFLNIQEYENGVNNDLQIVLNNISDLEDQLEKAIFNEALEIELSEKVDKSTEKTKELEAEAQLVYDGFVRDIERYNIARSKYIQHKTDYDELQLARSGWIEKDNAIKDIRSENIRLFKERVPFEGLEIKEVSTTKKVEGEDVVTTKQHLYYNGRELNFQNLSKGETLEIAYQFQTFHNPRFRVVFIPEAQSLGSGYRELTEAAAAQGFQWIAEFTQADVPFTIQFKGDIR